MFAGTPKEISNQDQSSSDPSCSDPIIVVHQLSNKNGRRILKIIRDQNYYLLKSFSFQQPYLELSLTNRLMKRCRSALPTRKPLHSFANQQTSCRNNIKQSRRSCIFIEYVNVIDLFFYLSTQKALTIKPLSLTLKAQRVNDIIHKVIMLLLRSSNHQIYSLDSLLFQLNSDDTLTVTANTISFVGMDFVLEEAPLSQEDLREVYGILDSRVFERRPGQRLSLQLKFRAIGVLLLCLIFEKRVSLLRSGDSFANSEISAESLKRVIAETPQRFEQFLSNKQVRRRITQIEKEISGVIAEKGHKKWQRPTVRYQEFFQRVFVREEAMQWSSVVELLCPRQTPSLDFKELRCKDPELLSAKEVAGLVRAGLSKEEQTVFRELGLIEDSQLHLFLVVQLWDEELESIVQLLDLCDLNGFLYDSNNLNMKEKTIYLKNIMRIIYILQIKETDKFLNLRKRSQLLAIKQRRTSRFQYQFDNLIQNLTQAVSVNFGVLNLSMRAKQFKSGSDDLGMVRSYKKAFS